MYNLVNLYFQKIFLKNIRFKQILLLNIIKNMIIFCAKYY